MKNIFIPFLVLFLIISQSLIGQELIAEIGIPGEAYKYERNSFIGDVYVTPDEKYIVMSLNYKPSVYSIHDFKTLELVSLIKVTGFSYDLLYNKSKGDFFVRKGPNRGFVLMTEIEDSYRLGFVPTGYEKCFRIKSGENYGQYTFRYGPTGGTKRKFLQIFDDKSSSDGNRPSPQIPEFN